ncbi:ABC transporter substrate-binding protein [Rhodobacteraceae bacterium RKSG542]|uniref:ABC transporter substrate-binding protein n=1 Tax=Pseudovibrio flavus TaxID=2529854 RepID=UPI0012BBF7AF|nr:ABC transporter substrate-binding protein [Pseudovibrio flavus]MTI17031.1 ABC transporter substrate-binding protein [Pseudovibrio flavus]
MMRYVALAFLMLLTSFGSATAMKLKETPGLPKGMPPIAERIPKQPLVTDLPAIGRSVGRHGGTLETLIGRAKDVRLINVWGYARIIGYDESLQLVPDIALDVESASDKVITITLREGHRWSDGHPFTTEDFRFWFEDVVGNVELNPLGMPAFMLAGGLPPEFEVISPTKMRFTWDKPNPQFLPELAKARPPFIYRPAHYLKRYHKEFGDQPLIRRKMKEHKARSWASLFNKLDDMYDAQNPELPTLQPWMPTPFGDARRFVLKRNFFFHRMDSEGQQLPYIGKVVMTVVDSKLIAAKALAGETDLQARGLSFSDIAVLKQGEGPENYITDLWYISKGSQISILPNLTVKDPVWRALMRDTRFRHALSLGIDRQLINKVLYFGLAKPGNDTVLSASPLYKPSYQNLFAEYDPKKANALLDEIGLDKRTPNGTRMLPDGRPLEIIVEVSGESQEEIDAMALVGETWQEIGIKIYVKPSQRDIMRNRALSGALVMSVWTGFENGLPTANMPPTDFVPARGDFLSWSLWGEYYETGGKSGEKPDWAPAISLLQLYDDWLVSGSEEDRADIWEEILKIHAQETIHIGLVSEVRQPVVVKGLKNVPLQAVYGWDPGAQFGMHRMDAFYFDRPEKHAKPHGGPPPTPGRPDGPPPPNREAAR